MPEGFKFTNSQGVRGEVYCYHDPQSVDVKWEDGVVTFNHAAANIRKGALYYPNAKTVTDVGYFGIGDYIPDRNGRNGNYNKTVYRKWAHMIMRCYNPYEINKDSCRAYKDVEVCEEWKCFQNFAKWAEDHLPKFVDGFELDKDMFGTGYLYCPEYCVLLPDKVNGFLSNNYSNKSSGLPEGVNVIKPKTKNSKVGYCARCHVEGKRKYLGYYDTPEEAGEVYRLAKEAEAVRLAEEYKDLLTPVEYDKLRGFTLKDIHRK
ncbi:MAG: hypothetical protein GY928_23220 [Colwellia sp.]|nr:hypothetical protein [Colwellia sp.]